MTTVYLIERTDTKEWYSGLGKWTNDATQAHSFDEEKEAIEIMSCLRVLQLVDAKIIVTEHEFI